MDYNTFEIYQSQNFRQVVEFFDADGDSLDHVHCVPESWKWQDKASSLLLLGNLDQPQDISRKQADNYQSSDDDSTFFTTELIYSSDSYDDVMNYYIKECKNIENSSAEVSMEIESPQRSEPNSSLISEIEECSFLLEFDEEINRQMNSDPQTMIVDTVDNIINGAIEISKFETEPENSYDFEKDVHLNVPSMPLKTNGNMRISRTFEDMKQNNTLLEATGISRHADKKWTLKYPEYLPGLVELMPNTGVYLEEAELWNCLRSSKTYTRLTSLLTTSIFTKSALKKCTYIAPGRGDHNNRLDLNAVKTILNFVQLIEYKRSARVPTINTLKCAIRYQLRKCKERSSIECLLF